MNSQYRSLQHSSKPQHALSLHLVGFSSSYTRVTASSTCAGVWFQIPHHASILVFIFRSLYPMQLSKESNLTPRSLTLTFFFFQFWTSPSFCASSVQHFDGFKQEGNSGYPFHQTAKRKSYYSLEKVHVLLDSGFFWLFLFVFLTPTSRHLQNLFLLHLLCSIIPAQRSLP